MNFEDPTAFAIDFDPTQKRMKGRAVHGNTWFDVPFISEIVPGFYQGGCEQGLILPLDIEYVVSLYKWERYSMHEDVKAFTEVEMYDNDSEPDYDNVVELATLVNEYRKQGTTLVHCQAGLNRSGLIAGAALVLEGMEPAEAISLLREKRSPAVLCNKTFENWLLNFHKHAPIK